MSLSSEFPASDIFTWATSLTHVPPPTHPTPPPVNRDAVYHELKRLNFDPFHCDPVRYPRRAPNVEEWKHYLDSLSGVVLEERSFQQDSQSLVEARTEDTACANGRACVAYSQAEQIRGLDRPIILQRLPPPHAPFCLLCYRSEFGWLLHQERSNRALMNAPSQLERPGPIPYVHKALRPVQTFYNLRDVHGEYSSTFMLIGEEDDVIVLPLARLHLSCLRPVKGSDGIYAIDQSAMRYLKDDEAQVRPGETVHELKERV